MKEWFYSKGEQQLGPVTEDKLRQLIQQGGINSNTDLVWSEGMAEWTSPAKAGVLSAGVSSANPYAAPTVEPLAAPSGSLPFVKPANFALMATLVIVGFIAFVAGLVIYMSEESPLAMIIGLAGLGTLITGGIISLIYLHRGWTILQPHTPHSTPGKAVGFLFIPLFSLYWNFVAYWRFSQEWNRIIANNPANQGAPRMAEGLFLTYAILNVASMLISLAAFGYIIMKQVCDGVNYAANQARTA